MGDYSKATRAFVFHPKIKFHDIVRMLIENDIEVFEEACTHIIPVMVRDAKRCKAISDRLLNVHGIYIQPINYPTVDVGTERLRITPTPLHTNAMMADLVVALKETFREIT